MEQNPVFGNDLGTTNTVIACSLPEGSPTIVDIRNSRSTPSVVSFVNESFFVGNEVDTDPDMTPPRQTVRMVKRIIGLHKSVFDSDRKSYSMLHCDVVQDEDSGTRSNEDLLRMCSVCVDFRGKKRVYRPEFISGLLLAYVRSELISMYHLEDCRPAAVISVPAYFNTTQRRATEAAGKMAGSKVLRVVNEPTAGAFSYALQRPAESIRFVLVYDFGGGTFDCTTLLRKEVDHVTQMQVIATKGDHILGGEDIDEEILKLLLKKATQIIASDENRKARNDFSEKVRSNEAVLVKLRQIACEAKEMMTKKNLKRYKVRLQFEELSPFDNISFDFTLPDLQDVIDPFFSRSEELIDKVLQESKWEVETVTDVVLLGGSSKLATVHQSIRSKFREEVTLHNSINPDTAVALGAAAVARQAARKLSESETERKSLDNYHLQEVTSYSLGIECSDGTVDVFVQRHTKVPAMGMMEMHAQDDLSEVSMYVCEGEGALAIENRQIGFFELEEGTLHSKGPSFDLEWEIDENFDLHLNAVDGQRAREVEEDGNSKSTVERGLSLNLTGLTDNQIAMKAVSIGNMMKRQEFLVMRGSLITEIERLSGCVSFTAQKFT